MNIIKNILFLLLSILVVSCEEEIDFKGDISDPLLVINSIVKPNEEIKVALTQSRFFLSENDNKYKVVKDGKVNLFVNNEFKEELFYTKIPIYDYYFHSSRDDEVYMSTYKPKAGDILQIKASSPKLNNVESEIITIPNKVELHSIKKSNYKAETTKHNNWYYDFWSIEKEEDYEEDYEEEEFLYSYTLNENFKLNFDFQDQKGVNNFYLLEIFHKKVFEDGDEDITNLAYLAEDYEEEDYYEEGVYYGIESYFRVNNSIFSQSLDVGLDLFDFNDYYSKYFIIDDALFDGKKITFDISINSFNYSINIDDIVENKLIIKITHLSKDYYLYRKTVNAYEANYGSMFSEPVQIYSNIKGGIGIFAGTSSTEYVLDLPTNFKE